MLTWIRNIPIHCDILRVHDCSFILTQLFIKIKKNKKNNNKETNKHVSEIKYRYVTHLEMNLFKICTQHYLTISVKWKNYLDR